MKADVLLERFQRANDSDLDELKRDLKLTDEALQGVDRAEKCGLLADELRSAAGHTLMNFARRIRGEHIAYREILIDVADKLTPGLLTRSGFHGRPEIDDTVIEDYIVAQVRRLSAERLKAMSSEERMQLQDDIERKLREQGMSGAAVKSAGAAIAAGSLSGIALSAAASAALYSSLWTAIVGLSARQVLLSGLAVGGPVGIVAGVAMFLTSPSYGKTIPAVVRLCMIRHSHDEREALARELG